MKKYPIKNIVEYVVALISEFASKFGLTESQAARYIDLHRGFEYLESNYGIIHTLSFNDAVESLQHYCKRNGGEI